MPQNSSDAIISVTDNGRGIPPEILSRLGQLGETHGKQGGSGLGLYHARTTVESWGGRLEIDSTVGFGTTIMVKLPLAQAPKWFVRKLSIASNSKVIALDDDSSIHRIWDGRFESARTQDVGIEILHFSTPTQLKEWVQSSVAPEALFLVDYELLGFSETGLDLIESLKIHDRSILVTSRFEEPQIRARCERLGVRLIPKAMAAYVPIEVIEPKPTVDAILIDDDMLVHAMWQMAAKEAPRTRSRVERMHAQGVLPGEGDSPEDFRLLGVQAKGPGRARAGITEGSWAEKVKHVCTRRAGGKRRADGEVASDRTVEWRNGD